METVLHDYWRSSASYRVRIALALKGIAYDRIAVDLVRGEQGDPYNLGINPQGLVPTLEIDGKRFVQSLAIIEYLDQTRPEPPLLPDTAEGRAHVRALALAVACEIHPVSNLRVLARVEKIGGADARLAWNRENIASGLDAIERMLDFSGFIGRFCYRSTPTMADCVLIPQLYNATRWEVDFSYMPRICAVAKSCAELPAFQDAAPVAPT